MFSATPAEYTASHWVVDESIAFLRQRDPQAPFFMWVSFEAPHSPNEAPEQFVRLYDGIDIPAPVAGGWAEGDRAPHTLRHRRLTHNLDTLSPALIRAARRHYYAQITHVDYELGRLFRELQSQEPWQDTVVIFTSDHGDMLGDFGSFHKSLFYDPSARVPYLLRIPERHEPPLPAGSVVDEPALLVDLYATCLDLAGLSRTDESDAPGSPAIHRSGAAADDYDATVLRDGMPLTRLGRPRRPGGGADGGDATEAGPAARRWVFGQLGSGRDATALATDGRTKYVYYAAGGVEQLFDLNEDPTEQHDLAGDPTHAATLAACQARLAAEIPGLATPDGQLRRSEAPELDENKARAANPFAWRGPIRYGGHW